MENCYLGAGAPIAPKPMIHIPFPLFPYIFFNLPLYFRKIYKFPAYFREIYVLCLIYVYIFASSLFRS